MEFTFQIKETLVKKIIVECDDENEALNILKKAYADEKIVLDWEDFIDTKFSLVADSNGAKIKIAPDGGVAKC